MVMRTLLLALLISSVLANGVRGASPWTVRSGPPATRLLELYSSEGCSSCPPADTWLAGLRQDPGLWKSFVPVEFHVDYWNRLGWTDRFSRDSFTARQHAYAHAWGSDSVYTPGFVLAGQEWKHSATLPPVANTPEVGVLEATQTDPTHFRVSFRAPKPGTDWRVHAARLGNGLASQVQAGENRGRTLRHEFVALELTEAPLDSVKGAVLELRLPTAAKAASYSVAFWITRGNSPTPIQAVGGDLPQ